MATIDEIINEVFSDKQEQLPKVEAVPADKAYSEFTIEERLDMLPF